MAVNEVKGEPLRYERKFLISDRSLRDVLQFIQFHPACFTEIFRERRINNIYLDNPGFESYYENVEGNPFRKKARIRWYGDLFGTVRKPVLEYKIKKSLLGHKVSHVMEDFEIRPGFSWNDIQPAISSLPLSTANEIRSIRPVLLNSYVRKYFLSADKVFRITVDQQLTWYSMGSFNNQFIRKVSSPDVVVELKYDSAEEEKAGILTAALPFTMTKNSKYQQGVEKLYHFA
jgi:hypothetical protein